MLKIELIDGQRWLVGARLRTPLRSFSDCHGQLFGSVFILASGPSANDFSLKKYSQYPIMAMNGSILRCSSEGVPPLFYLCDDASFAKDRPEIALLGLNLAKHVAMSLAVLEQLHKYDINCLAGRSIYLLERVNRFHGKQSLPDRAYAWSIRNDEELISGFSFFRKKPNRIGFSLNMEKGYFVARTIPYVGLQLAYHLGFEQVFIIGMDLQPKVGRFYESGDAALPSTLDEDYVDYILPSFKFLSCKVSFPRVFDVYNLSISSRLPSNVVPKLELHRLEEYLCVYSASEAG